MRPGSAGATTRRTLTTAGPSSDRLVTSGRALLPTLAIQGVASPAVDQQDGRHADLDRRRRDVLGVPMTPLDIVTQVKQAAAAGFPAAWSVHFSRGIDALSVLVVAGAQTAGIVSVSGSCPATRVIRWLLRSRRQRPSNCAAAG